MSALNPGGQIRLATDGILLQRPATTLVQNTSTALFAITGGDIRVNYLYGKVTTAVAATGSLTAKVVFTPSGGSVADISAATGITSDAIGTFYTVDGVAASLLSLQTIGGSEVPTVTFGPLNPGAGFILPAGVLAVTVSNHDPGTGAVKWNLAYIPVDAGATVALS